LYLTVMSL